MADYIFPRYTNESLYVATYFYLERVELEFQTAILVDKYNYSNSPKIWKYRSQQYHKYIPENTIKIPIRSSSSLATIDLQAFVQINRDNYFPSDLINLPWINSPLQLYGDYPYSLDMSLANIYGTYMVFVTNQLTTVTQASTQSKPPDRWYITYRFVPGHRVPPSYENLLTGYSRDFRAMPTQLRIKSATAQIVTLKYYRSDPYEHIPNREWIDIDRTALPVVIGDDIDPNKSRLITINWYTQTIELVANQNFVADITGIVLGTLQLTSQVQNNLLISTLPLLAPAIQGTYNAQYLLNKIDNLDELFDYWAFLFNDDGIQRYFGQAKLNELWLTDKRLPFTYSGFDSFDNRWTCLAITEGFNNYWNNYQLPLYNNYIIRPGFFPLPQQSQQLSFYAYKILEYHPFFKSLPLLPVPVSYPPYTINPDHVGSHYTLSNTVDPNNRRFDKAYNNYHPFNHANLLNWHLKPQIFNNIDYGIGTVPMDTIRTIAMEKALEGLKYSTNELDPSKPRIATLAWHINRQSEVLGIRVKADGKVDEELEKTTNRRLHVEGSQGNDIQKFNPNCFGSEGMLVRHLPNKFGNKRNSCPVSGGYRKVRDIPQLLAELHEQANAAMGYQEGTAIEINVDGEVYRYPNQLALMTEIFVTLKQSATYSKGAFFSSVVGEQSIKEVISGLGLRTVDKYLEFKVAGGSIPLFIWSEEINILY